jgi:hypothetical protein
MSFLSQEPFTGRGFDQHPASNRDSPKTVKKDK